MYLKLLHKTMSYSAAVTSGTVSRYSIFYVVNNSSHVTLGQDLIYEEENIDRVLSWFNPSQQLGPTQPLAHFPLVGWGRESEE